MGFGNLQTAALREQIGVAESAEFDLDDIPLTGGRSGLDDAGQVGRHPCCA